MKKRSSLLARICACATSLVLLVGMFPHTALADSYTSTTMRLLHYEGDVAIEDSSGNPRAVMENARFNSGEAMKTGAASSASVGLDEGRIVTMDEKSRVEFQKQDGAVSMNLTEGKIFLDVSEKLGSDETMDIKTSTMVVGIRGTIVYVSSEPVTDETAANMESVNLEGLSPEKGSIVSISQIGVLEGTAQITYLDDSKQEQSVSVDAGKKATVPEYSEDAEGIPAPAVSDITRDDIEGFVIDQVKRDAAVIDRVQQACDVLDDIDLSGLAGIYTADGEWTWDSPVTLVAQSASKYYDGQPLTRTSDILVNGLPNIFTVKASAGGSRTDAGESDNPVSNYTIYNKAGEDVTRHFSHIETVSGTLLVVPAPLTIHTGTAEKVYDGTPLTEPDAYITFYKGSGSREAPWRNTSYVVTESTGNVSYDNQTLYGICGVIWVNAANPLTGERREIQLKAGQKLTVFLSDLEGKQSIELKIENLSENDLPDELLRLYGDNPALLEQACKDTGWNIELLRTRIEALPDTPSGTATIEQGGLVIRESESDRLMQNLTNVRITIDTEITDYNNRALGSEEAHYTSLAVDETIIVKAVGSQTDVGTSINTYTIDWGTADRSNYEVGEDLGKLTVTPASATVTTGSSEKEYDGSPLTNSEASISGLVNGETATVTATGSITEVGSTENTYSISWNSAKSSNYSVSESLGTLRVTSPMAAVTLTSASAEKTYDGTPLTDSSVTAEGLPSGFTVSAALSGSQTDVGSSDNTIDSYTIYDADGNDVTDRFSNVSIQNGTLKVTPKEVTITTGSAAREYDGSPLTNSEASISGLVDGETAAVTASGSITDVGSAENTYSISWDSANSSNYSVSESLGTLQVTENTSAVTLTAASAEKTYNGTALTDSSFSAEGLPSGFTVSADVSGSRTDAGSSGNSIESYTIYNADGADVTDYFSNITTQSGILTVNPFPVEFDAGFHVEEEEIEVEGGDAPEAAVEYDGYTYFSEWITASYEGADEPVAPVDYYINGDMGTYSFTYTLPWGAKLELNGTGYTDAGSYTFEPEITFLEGKKDNYEITFTGNKLTILPASLTITASASKEYDGTPLYGTDAIKIEGLADRDSISVTSTAFITKAGTVDNPYTISWGDTNPDNYTVTQEPGTLEITPKEVTITTGSKEKVYDGETLFYNSYELSPSDPWVNGQAPRITVTGSRTIAGESENTCNVEWKGVDPSNYKVTVIKGKLKVEPVQIVLTSKCQIAVSGDITIKEYGLLVQVNNVDTEHYYVTKSDENENEWRITFDWGDTIDVSTILFRDETSYSITPIHDVENINPDNYNFETVDQSGEFDVPVVFPEDGFGMGMSSAFGAIAGRSLSSISTAITADTAAENDEDDDHSASGEGKNVKDEGAATAPAEPASDELVQEETSKEELQEENKETPAPEEPEEEADEAPAPEEPHEEEEETPAPEEPHEEEEETSEPEEPQEEEEETSEPEEPQEEADGSPAPEEP